MRAFALVLGALGLGTLALTLAGRVGFAWPLEWMEGATLHHALRLVEGKPLYAVPSAEFIGYLYPPLAYMPMALSVAAFGPTLEAARLPSLLALAAILFLVGRSCARASNEPVVGVLAAGMFAAGYGYTGAFLDLARVDAVFLLLVVAGAERMQAGRPRAALALLLASAFAKQHGVLLLFAASAWLLVIDARKHRAAVLLAWAAGACAYVALALATDGWFHRYVVALPASQPVEATYLASFFFVDVLVYLPVLAIAAAAALWRDRGLRDPLAALLVAGLVVGALGRAHVGGHDNVRLPAFALLVLVAVPPLARAMLTASTSPARALAALALCIQLAILWQPPSAHAPTASSAQAFEALSRELARCADGGSSVALDHALITGTPFMHSMALSDLQLGADPELARDATDALLATLRAPNAPRAIAVGEHFAALDQVLVAHFRECARVPAPRLATGHQPGLTDAAGRWQRIYVP